MRVDTDKFPKSYFNANSMPSMPSTAAESALPGRANAMERSESKHQYQSLDDGEVVVFLSGLSGHYETPYDITPISPPQS
jgi:hypothetical protein